MLLKEKGVTEESGQISEKSKTGLVKKPAFILAIALIICFISTLGSSLVKSNGGSITVKKLNWETPSGHMQNAQLFIPKTATKESPAPAVVVSHGWYDNSDMQTPNYVELSRRGYVVIAIDMYGHGDSDDLPIDSWWNDENAANGLYDSVKLLATLPYVDTSKIGIEGHSNGANACNRAVLLDNKAAKPLISSVLLVCNDPIFTDTVYYGQYFDGTDTDFTNVYGDRNIGVVAAKYDEAFHRIQYPDGTLTAPRDYINTVPAQSFLNFGKDPTGLEKRNNDTMYNENINGKDAIRVIYTPNINHPWAFMSSQVTSQYIDFFQKAIPAPSPLAPDNQSWQWKVFFETMGIMGFFMFLVNFILVLLETRFFGVLKAQEPVLPVEIDRKGKAWLWGGLTASALFSAISFPIFFVVGLLTQPTFFNQSQPWVLGLWSAATGLFTLLLLFLTYRSYSKAKGLNLREQGVFLSKDKIWKTILLGVLAAVCTYSIVFVTDYFFTTDFRYWFIFRFRAFDAVKFIEILKYMLFFMFFYMINSIAMNVFNYVKIGKKEWINTLLMCIFNVLGTVVLLVIYYAYFLKTGLLLTDHVGWGLGTMVFFIYPLVVVLPVATVINRIIYKKTRNPYISSIAFSLIITTSVCSNVLTHLI